MAKPELNWNDDVLGRKTSADFLHRLVIRRYEAYHSAKGATSLCFAVDADWGAGKSFFIDRWSNDLDAIEHPTIHFDAWANDLSDDPLVGFLAELQKSLKPWLDQRPVTTAVRVEFRSRLDALIKQAGKAALPSLKALGIGVAKRYTGSALEEMSAIWAQDHPPQSSAQSESSEADGLEKKTTKADVGADKAVEKFLEISLKSHSDKQLAVQKLRRNLEGLVEYLVEKAKANAPLFIFVDELDRCRPDYAIRLLEGMKHLFNARGVCFVVSTNLQQLSSAVKAVYGQDFNAYRYLKKFFNFEYTLPTPDNASYSRLLISGSMLSKAVEKREILIQHCLPPGLASGDPRDFEDVLIQSFAYIADAMNLNLRSQRQVFEHAENSLVGLTSGMAIPPIYAFFLAALLHNGLESFDSIFDPAGFPIEAKLTPFFVRDVQLKYYIGQQEQSIAISTIVQQIHSFVCLSYTEARNRVNQRNLAYPYTEYLGLVAQSGNRLYIAGLGNLIRNSGYVSAT